MGFTRAAIAGLLVGAVNASPYVGYGNGTQYTTKVVTELTTYCPEPTTLTYNDKTYTITKATTLTITDCPCTVTEPKPTGTKPPKVEECIDVCNKAYNDCRTAKSANMAYCAAQYASCLGYNPFAESPYVTPTACSTKEPKPTKPVSPPVYTTKVVTALTTYCPEPTTISHNNKTYTITEPTTFTITDCPCTVTEPKPTGTHPVKEEECVDICNKAYNDCRSAKGANMATCAAQYAQCLGYNPFEHDGAYVTPTACSVAPTGTAPVPVKPTAPAPGKPTAPAPVNPTAPEPTKPAPANPTQDTPDTVVTAAAGRVAPAGIMLALGAVALL